MSFDIRPMTESDIPAGLALSESAGWNQTERDWRIFLSRKPEGSVVGLRDGRVVGTAATLDYGPFAWISMVLVAQELRGQGLGGALFARTLEILRESPCARLDATPLGEPVYRKLGFEDEYLLERWERPAGPVPEAPEVERLEDIRPIAALDREVFGADRGWLLSWLREDAPHLALRSESGFLLGREGRRYTHLGPLLASSDDEAHRMILAALAVSKRDAVIDIPVDKAQLAEALGFRKQRCLLRMRRGGPAPPLDARLYAIAGPELG